MLSNYQVKNSETEDVLKDICRLNAASKVMVNHRITVAVVGFAIAVVFVRMTDFFEGNLPLKVLAYIAIWLAAFGVGEILGRTVGMKSAVVGAEGEGMQVYKQRIQKWGQPLEVKVEFYDTYFTTWAKGLQKRKIEFTEALELIESKETIAIIARLENNPKKQLYAFPKAGLQGVSEEDFKKFIEEKCVNVKKGFRFYKYNHK